MKGNKNKLKKEDKKRIMQNQRSGDDTQKKEFSITFPYRQNIPRGVSYRSKGSTIPILTLLTIYLYFHVW